MDSLFGSHSVLDSGYSTPVLPKFCRIFPRSCLPSFGAYLLNFGHGVFVREFPVQHREVGWHKLPILEGADLQRARAKEAKKSYHVCG